MFLEELGYTAVLDDCTSWDRLEMLMKVESYWRLCTPMPAFDSTMLTSLELNSLTAFAFDGVRSAVAGDELPTPCVASGLSWLKAALRPVLRRAGC